MKIPILLLAVAAGYGVLVVANKQERPLDVLGRILGGIILLVSVLSLVCAAVCSVKCARAACSRGKMMCAYSAPAADAPETVPVAK